MEYVLITNIKIPEKLIKIPGSGQIDLMVSFEQMFDSGHL